MLTCSSIYWLKVIATGLDKSNTSKLLNAQEDQRFTKNLHRQVRCRSSCLMRLASFSHTNSLAKYRTCEGSILEGAFGILQFSGKEREVGAAESRQWRHP